MSKRDEYLAGARAGIAVFAGASQMMAVGMYAQGAVFVLYLVI